MLTLQGQRSRCTAGVSQRSKACCGARLVSAPARRTSEMGHSLPKRDVRVTPAFPDNGHSPA